MKEPELKSASRQLPPYGFINEQYMAPLREYLPIPGDWRGFPRATESLDEQWNLFRTKTLALINEVLWPTFDKTGDWKGQSASFMEDLTRADLALMLELQERNELDQRISPPGHSGGSPTHRELFEGEDEAPLPIGSNYSRYDPNLPYRLVEKIPVLWRRALSSKCGTSVLYFKSFLQRPRPYQTALLLGYADFRYQQAKSADTPSMCSGHCLQGSLTIGASMERFLLDNERLALNSWLALEQFTVDLGDRRVMAGVHYPSDNICSWLIALLMADHVYRTPKVKQRLWHAISKRSIIFRAILVSVKSGKGKSYRPALQALQDAASGKISY